MNAEEFQAAIEAVDLTAEDAREQILKLNEGLMKSNATLLTESKANKTAAQEANEATEAARQLAAAAKEQELIANGKTDELKTFYENQLAEKTAALQVQTDAAMKALNDRDKSAAIGDILSQVDPRYKAFVETQLQSSVSISYDETGKAVTSIKDGDAQYSSPADFLNGVKESDTWKHVLTATALSGANTQQSNGGNHSANETVQSKLADRLRAQGLTQ